MPAIRNPIEWTVDEIKLAIEALRATGHALRHPGVGLAAAGDLSALAARSPDNLLHHAWTRAAVFDHCICPRRSYDGRGLGHDYCRHGRRISFRCSGAVDQRRLVSIVAGPRRGASHGGNGFDPCCDRKPGSHGCLGNDCCWRSGSRHDPIAAWSHYHPTRARAAERGRSDGAKCIRPGRFTRLGTCTGNWSSDETCPNRYMGGHKLSRRPVSSRRFPVLVSPFDV
jgi:hypothetical protein